MNIDTSTMTDEEYARTQEAATIDAMIVNGGSFVRALGRAATLGDRENRDRIRKAFPEYWEKYARLACNMETPQEELRRLSNALAGNVEE